MHPLRSAANALKTFLLDGGVGLATSQLAAHLPGEGAIGNHMDASHLKLCPAECEFELAPLPSEKAPRGLKGALEKANQRRGPRGFQSELRQERGNGASQNRDRTSYGSGTSTGDWQGDWEMNRRGEATKKVQEQAKSPKRKAILARQTQEPLLRRSAVTNSAKKHYQTIPARNTYKSHPA